MEITYLLAAWIPLAGLVLALCLEGDEDDSWAGEQSRRELQ